MSFIRLTGEHMDKVKLITFSIERFGPWTFLSYYTLVQDTDLSMHKIFIENI